MVTKRQLQILKLVKKGKTNKVIAKKMGISVNTVIHQLYRINKRLNTTNRIEASNKI